MSVFRTVARNQSKLFGSHSVQSRSSHSDVAKSIGSKARVLAAFGVAAGVTLLSFQGVSAEEKFPQAYVWGRNQYGQLGLGNEVNQPVPRILDLKSAPIAQLVAGAENGAALTKNGELYTFGRGQYKVLGHGNDSSLLTPKLIDSVPVKFRYVSASGDHMAAVDENGEVWTWGHSALGRPGPGELPAKVTAFEGKKIRSVACGHNHTLAITDGGELYAWGKNYSGELGLGGKEDHAQPKLVETLRGHKIVQVGAGFGSSIVLTESGEVYTFGANDYGQTGHGTAQSERYIRLPTQVRFFGKKKVKQISMGEYHAACVTEDGEAYVWGRGLDGQIGIGTRQTHNHLPSLVNALKGKKIVEVACGGGHTAAIDSNSNLYVWGRGNDGQLGRGEELESVAINRLEPVHVEFFSDNKLKVHQVSLGRDFSMAVAS